MRDVHIGFIGCGGIANGKHLPALSHIESAKLDAFCDIIRERAEKAAKQYGSADARVYTDYREMLEKEKGRIEVVHVLTPNKLHAPMTCDALEAGYHVMCEKPMAKDVAGAERMLETAKRTGKKLTIGYQNRFVSENLFLKRACEEGELGDIYYARAIALRRRAVPTWGVFLDEDAQGGGPLIDIGTHALDLTLFMMNNYEPQMVMGTTYKKLRGMKNAANAWGHWDPEKFTVEDSAFGFIRFKNGATCVLESSWALNIAEPIEARTQLCGTKAGADTFDGLRINGERYGRLYIDKVDCSAGGVDFYAGSADTPADREARGWLSHIADDTPLYTKPEQALVVTKILAAIYESAASGQCVYLS